MHRGIIFSLTNRRRAEETSLMQTCNDFTRPDRSLCPLLTECDLETDHQPTSNHEAIGDDRAFRAGGRREQVARVLRNDRADGFGLHARKLRACEVSL